MRKIFSACLLLVASFTAQAQLVSSLNMSTGHNNATGTALPVGVQDPEWRVTALTAPFIPAGAIPYNAFTQTPWGPGPVTPANTRWISYNAVGMTLSAPADFTGGSSTYEYTFETCREDEIRFNATMYSDNRISAVRVDGVSTGWSQPTFTTLNWNPGSGFGYVVVLPAGVHTLEVDVLNAPSGNNTNPTGLNVSGFVSSTGNSIIDRTNFPDFRCCNANFRYCIGTANPYLVDFSADDPSQPGNFDWFVNGSHIGSGPNISYTLTPGSYEVCMRYSSETGEGCDKCIRICIADNGKVDAVPAIQGKSVPSDHNSNIALAKDFEVAKVYPNPTNAELNVELQSAKGTSVSIKLVDALGKVVSEQSVRLPEGQKKISIATGKLAAGIYSLHVSDGKTVIVDKVQVQK